MSYLNFYACATCHGSTTQALFDGLLKPNSHLTVTSEGVAAYKLKNLNPKDSVKDNILSQLAPFINSTNDQFFSQKNETWGLILASTKGVIEDFIWKDSVNPEQDPYQPLLADLNKMISFNVKKETVVSNACASSHGAIELGQKWLARGHVDNVIIVAADIIGPFIHKGFSSLRALSESKVCRPFDKNRDGLLLGDGVGVAVLSNKPTDHSLFIDPVNNQCESFSVTRPDISGETLGQCLKKSTKNRHPDVMIAHGTATYYNDITESNAINLCFENKQPPLITATKWATGHSLGASGLIDLCVAAEIIKQKIVPAIHTLQASDFKIHEWIVRENKKASIESVLISSLGFGGICSSFLVREVGTP